MYETLHLFCQDGVIDHDDQFPVGIFQTGLETSTHTNVNKVIVNLVIELTSAEKG